MSSRVAYSLAVIVMASPLVIVPSLYFYNLHRQHEAEKAMKVEMAAWKDKIETERQARQNQ